MPANILLFFLARYFWAKLFLAHSCSLLLSLWLTLALSLARSVTVTLAHNGLLWLTFFSLALSGAHWLKSSLFSSLRHSCIAPVYPALQVHSEQIHILKDQGDLNCGVSSQADFILNYFLSNFLKFLQISSQILHFLPARLAGWNN